MNDIINHKQLVNPDIEQTPMFKYNNNSTYPESEEFYNNILIQEDIIPKDFDIFHCSPNIKTNYQQDSASSDYILYSGFFGINPVKSQVKAEESTPFNLDSIKLNTKASKVSFKQDLNPNFNLTVNMSKMSRTSKMINKQLTSEEIEIKKIAEEKKKIDLLKQKNKNFIRKVFKPKDPTLIAPVQPTLFQNDTIQNNKFLNSKRNKTPIKFTSINEIASNKGIVFKKRNPIGINTNKHLSLDEEISNLSNSFSKMCVLNEQSKAVSTQQKEKSLSRSPSPSVKYPKTHSIRTHFNLKSPNLSSTSRILNDKAKPIINKSCITNNDKENKTVLSNFNMNLKVQKNSFIANKLQFSKNASSKNIKPNFNISRSINTPLSRVGSNKIVTFNDALSKLSSKISK
jgi:hypothetical protein